MGILDIFQVPSNGFHLDVSIDEPLSEVHRSLFKQRRTTRDLYPISRRRDLFAKDILKNWRRVSTRVSCHTLGSGTSEYESLITHPQC